MSLETIIETFQTTIVEWGESLLGSLPNLVAAVLSILGFWLLARAARSVVRRALGHVVDNRQALSLLSTVSYLAVLFAGLSVALNILNLEKTVTSLLAGVGIVGLALGFAFQDLAANFMSGIFMSFRQIFRHGDLIEAGDILGKVEAMDLRSTWVKTFEGQLICIPNRKLFEAPLINYTRSGCRRVDVDVRVSYDSDLEEVKEAAIEAVEDVPERDTSKDTAIVFEGFGASSIDLSVRFWIEYPDQDFLAARSNAVLGIKRVFDERGIRIPFPIRTLDLPRASEDSSLELVLAQADGTSDD